MRNGRGRPRRSSLTLQEQSCLAQQKFREKQEKTGIVRVQVTMRTGLRAKLNKRLADALERGDLLSRSEIIVDLIRVGLDQTRSPSSPRIRN